LHLKNVLTGTIVKKGDFLFGLSMAFGIDYFVSTLGFGKDLYAGASASVFSDEYKANIALQRPTAK
jgi:hypothetical protein